MSLITIFSILALLPVFYIGKKIVMKKKALTLFDVLIVAHSFYFGFIPLFSSHQILEELCIEGNSNTTIQLYLIYFSFIGSITLISKGFSKYIPNSIINITHYVGKLPPKRSSNANIIILSIILIVSWYIMFPYSHMFHGMMDKGNEYTDTSAFMLMATIFNIANCYLFLLHNMVKPDPNKRYLTILVISYLVSAFVIGNGRRYFIGLALLYGIIYYVKNRYNIQWSKKILPATFFLLILYFSIIVFNVVRYSKYDAEFNNDFIGSTSNALAISINNYGEYKNLAAEANESRSLGVFQTMYLYLNQQPKTFDGYLFGTSLSHAIPQIIFPAKSPFGSQEVLEIASGRYVDISDTVLFAGIGDWSILGGIMAALFYGVAFLLISLLHSFFSKRKLPLFFIAYSLYIVFHIAFHTEITIEGILAMLVQYVLIMSAFFIIRLFIFTKRVS